MDRTLSFLLLALSIGFGCKGLSNEPPAEGQPSEGASLSTPKDVDTDARRSEAMIQASAEYVGIWKSRSECPGSMPKGDEGYELLGLLGGLHLPTCTDGNMSVFADEPDAFRTRLSSVLKLAPEEIKGIAEGGVRLPKVCASLPFLNEEGLGNYPSCLWRDATRDELIAFLRGAYLRHRAPVSKKKASVLYPSDRDYALVAAHALSELGALEVWVGAVASTPQPYYVSFEPTEELRGALRVEETILRDDLGFKDADLAFSYTVHPPGAWNRQ